jgi:hypothetical protein
VLADCICLIFSKSFFSISKGSVEENHCISWGGQTNVLSNNKFAPFISVKILRHSSILIEVSETNSGHIHLVKNVIEVLVTSGFDFITTVAIFPFHLKGGLLKLVAP